MGQTEKAEHYQVLKAHGIEFDKHYREYTEQELYNARTHLEAELRAEVEPASDPELAGFFGFGAAPGTAPLAEKNPDEMAGQRLNSKEEWEPIRTDEEGRVWYQEEVLKAGYAKPRGRRVLRYEDTGVVSQTVQQGEYTETFEVSGTGTPRTSEIKITLPSYQTGIYKDPRFPFKIHTYNGVNGFDFEDVAVFYGDIDLVPEEIKRCYVENDLCWDIRTTVRAIETEYRRLQLAASGNPGAAHV